MRFGRKGQGGMSIITLLFMVVVLAGGAVLVAQVVPSAVEYQAIAKAAQKAANTGGSAGEVRQIFNKAAQIDNITSLDGKDLDVTKQGDQTVVKFAYDKEIHMFGPAYLLIKYAGQTKVAREF